jgi:hypothetical protein
MKFSLLRKGSSGNLWKNLKIKRSMLLMMTQKCVREQNFVTNVEFGSNLYCPSKGAL